MAASSKHEFAVGTEPCHSHLVGMAAQLQYRFGRTGIPDPGRAIVTSGHDTIGRGAERSTLENVEMALKAPDRPRQQIPQPRRAIAYGGQHETAIWAELRVIHSVRL